MISRRLLGVSIGVSEERRVRFDDTSARRAVASKDAYRPEFSVLNWLCRVWDRSSPRLTPEIWPSHTPPKNSFVVTGERCDQIPRRWERYRFSTPT